MNLKPLFLRSTWHKWLSPAQGRGLYHHVNRILAKPISASIVLVLVLISGLFTYGAIAGEPKPKTIILLLQIDLILLLFLGIIVARQIILLWIRRRENSIGARLQTKIVLLFSFLVFVPTGLVATFSILFFDLGIQSWFSNQVKTSIEESQEVARAYVNEHRQNIRADALAMANDINRMAPKIRRNPALLTSLIQQLASDRSLPEAIIFNEQGVIGRSNLSFALEFDKVAVDDLRRARMGEIVVIADRYEDRVRALMRLEGFVDNIYLYVGRIVDPAVLNHLKRTESAAKKYFELEGHSSAIQITFSLIFIVVSLLLLLGAVWLGLTFANKLLAPVVDLIGAADELRQGHYGVRVEETQRNDELDTLSRAFNRMAKDLEQNRTDLLRINTQLDQRRRFSEAVLAGVSAGVIGLDKSGRIELPNRRALTVLHKDSADILGKKLDQVLPELKQIFSACLQDPTRLYEAEINVDLEGQQRTLLVRLVTEIDQTKSSPQVQGYVVTFDDITDLVIAQNKAAWTDVARRVAHEIKNPLTPIQLSAEQLKRKFQRYVPKDQTSFATYIDTIVRQVGDIGRLVDEFSTFARMPVPVLEDCNIVPLLKEQVNLAQSAYPQVQFDLEIPDQPAHILCDRQLINQALTNLTLNAVQAIDQRLQQSADQQPGKIRFSLHKTAKTIALSVSDNGIGLPKEVPLQDLTNPYVTTKDQGTGLGLAIVRRIMEDHGGNLRLEAREEGDGCIAQLVFPLKDMISVAAKS